MTSRTTEAVRTPVTARRRIRWVAAVTCVVGAALLAATVNVERGTALFFASGFALAAVWTIGARLAGGRWHLEDHVGRDVSIGGGVGIGMFALFVIAAAVARQLHILEGPIDAILRQADAAGVGWVIALAVTTGIAEELFFRGALTNAFAPAHAAVWTTVVYVVVTAAGGNAALVIAAAVMGTVLALERRWTGALVSPIATHVVWSVLMITVFPRS